METTNETPLERFRNYLSRNSYRLTKEREQIAETVFQTETRFEAEELLYKIRREGKNVSRATIYRTLELLMESGEVQKHDFGDGYSVYEVQGNAPPDGYLYCEQCGQVIEFRDDKLRSLLDKVCEREDFKDEKITTKIFGYCSQCREGSDDSY